MKQKNAFTLFELLVSISIIAIMTAVATLSFSNSQKKARDSRRLQDLNNIQKAAEMYYSQHDYEYPLNDDGFTTVIDGENPVLQSWPEDPKTGVGYDYQLNVPAAGDYCVCVELDDAGSGNSSPNCNFTAGGDYYCVKNQQ